MVKNKRVLGAMAFALVLMMVAAACSKKATPPSNQSPGATSATGTPTGTIQDGGVYRSAIEDFGFTGAFDPTGEYLGTAFGLFSR